MIRYFLCFLLLVVVFSNAQTKNNTDIKNDTIKIKKYIFFAENTRYKNIDSSLFYCYKAISIIKNKQYSLSNNPNILQLHYNVLEQMHLAFSTIGDSKKSLFYAQESLLKAKKIKNIKNIKNAYLHIATSFEMLGNYKKALSMFLEVLTLQKKTHDDFGTSQTLNNIGGIYFYFQDNDAALDYYTKCLDIVMKLDKKTAIATTYNNIGQVLESQKKYSEALENYDKAVLISKNINNKFLLSVLYLNIGSIKQNTNQIQEAITYYEKGLPLAELVGNKETLVQLLSNMGECFIQKNDYQKAQILIKRADSLESEIKLNYLKVNILESLSTIYEYKKDYQKALSYYKQYTQEKDSLINEDKVKEIGRIEAKFEFDKQIEEQVIIQKQQEAISEAELQKQKTFRNAILICSLALLIVIIILVFNYQRRLKTNSILTAKNEELYRQKTLELIEKQQIKQLEAGIKGQENERLRIAQELHDGMGGTLSAIKHMLEKYKTTASNQSELDKIINNMDDACKEIRTISHDLIPPQLTNNIFTDLVTQLIESNKKPALAINLELINEDGLNKLSKQIQVELYRIVQELLKNIQKHAQASTVQLDICKYEKEINIFIEDNGVGFDVSKKNKGIGIRNIKRRVRALNGKISMDSQINRGTSINIIIDCEND